MSIHFDQDLIDAAFAVIMCILIAIVFKWSMDEK